MAVSRSLWLAFRRHVHSHLRGAALSVALLAVVAALPAGPWRNGGWTLGALLLLYYGYVLLALGGTVLGWAAELRRKAQHVWGGSMVIGLFLATGSATATAVLCLVQAGFAQLARTLPQLKLLHQLSLHRRDGTRSAGELLFPLALGATAVWAGTPTAAWLCGALVLVFSDTAAALVGRQFGRLRFRTWGGTKSLEGSAAFFCSTVCIALGLAATQLGVMPAMAGLLALAATLTAVEALAGMGTDNLAIPLTAAATWTWWMG
jgi:phytol kinase